MKSTVFGCDMLLCLQSRWYHISISFIDSDIQCLEQISLDSVIRYGAYILLICSDECPPKIRYP